MSRLNADRANAMRERADIDVKIAAARSGLAILEAQAAVLDRIMAPAPAAPPAEPKRRKRTTVREHDRNIPAPDPGAELPIEGKPT